MKKKIIIGEQLTLDDVILVAKDPSIKVELSDVAIKKIKENRKIIEKIVEGGKAVYGVNTGFGSLSDIGIEKNKLSQLQSNLVRSHSAGVGEKLSNEIVRAMMLLRAHNVSLGYSGVRTTVVETLLSFINNDIIPIIPKKGSVGASGDLAPLAHLALCLMGEAKVIYKGEIKDSKDVLRSNGIEPLKLEAKEGLALINGTQYMSAIGCLALNEAESLCKHADVISALSLNGIAGTFAAFDERISKLRPHKGQLTVSRNFKKLSGGSISSSHLDCKRVQDPYSFRCIPQVHGAVRDAVSYLKEVLSVEINSVTDNPLVFDDAIISGGNFHGEPIALALDFVSIAIAELSSISERRIDKLLTPTFNGGLPAYLAKESGLNSGLMIAQYTAASLVNENRVLAHPSSIDNISTSNNKEDHVSMGATGARKLLDIIKNTELVLAIELFCATEACSMREPLIPSKELLSVIKMVREKTPELLEDRVISDDILNISKLINQKKILEEVKVD